MLPWLLGAAAVAVAAAILSDDNDDKKSSHHNSDPQEEAEARRQAAQQRKQAAQKALAKEVKEYCATKQEVLAKTLEPYFVCEFTSISTDLKKETKNNSFSTPLGLYLDTVNKILNQDASQSSANLNKRHTYYHGLEKYKALQTVVNNIAYMQTRYEVHPHPTSQLNKSLANITHLDSQIHQLIALDEKVNELIKQIEE